MYNEELSKYLESNFGIIGESSSMQEAISLLMQSAPTDLSVLITGETGTGKEVFANALHGLSKRKNHPFVSVNCGAIPETLLESELFGHVKGAFTSANDDRKGFFETADKGTIFLDEIGEMPVGTQVKLLRILESGHFSRLGSSDVKQVDVRVIAATNRDLQYEVQRGNFRQDLFYRLKNVHIELPALSKHPDDIPLLAEYFIKKNAKKHGLPYSSLDPDTIQILKLQPWTGNVRELKNLIDTIVTLEKTTDITPFILRNYIRPALPQAEIRNTDPQSSLVKTESSIPDNELVLIFKTLLELQNNVNELKHISMKTLEDVHDLKEEVESKNTVYEIVEDDENADSLKIDDKTIAEVERLMIVRALDRFKGSRKQAAESLGISERTLYRKIKEYDL